MTEAVLEAPRKTRSFKKTAQQVRELPMAAHVRAYSRLMELVDDEEAQKAKTIGGHILGLAGYLVLTRSGLPSPLEKTHRN